MPFHLSAKWRERATTLWLGFTLAALFLYPLAATVDGSRYYLQWQPRHATGALGALAGLTLVASLTLWAVKTLPAQLHAVALVSLAAVPLASFGSGIAREASGILIPLWEHDIVRFGVPLAAVILAALFLIVSPVRFSRVMRAALFVLSPVSLVVLKPLLLSAGQPGMTVARAVPNESGALLSESSSSCPPIVAVLFDELSFSYLYDGSEIGSDFPSFRQFATGSTQHLSVSAPGRATLAAMPGFLAARQLHRAEVVGDRLIEIDPRGVARAFDATEPDGLFATARRVGYATEIAGYYLPYCELLGGFADTCESFSFYNAASFSDGASPLDAIETTLILWPRQFPLGLFKNHPFARQQRRLVEHTMRFASRPVGARAIFRLVHFSIPHLPFAFDRDGYNPPIDSVRTSPDTWYVRQMHYADRIFGELVDRLRRSGDFDTSTVVLLSDHGFRFGGREADALHIPFLVKWPGQRTPGSVIRPERGEILLREIVQRSCSADGSRSE